MCSGHEMSIGRYVLRKRNYVKYRVVVRLDYVTMPMEGEGRRFSRERMEVF